ncbi:uncharacterized protein LOC103130857, partial [Poecilia formosa]|uniref:uncharacterized protein LOC103130857 n=1 Tax=Poecilia formosa TaxID=48698 RepID=UPI0007B95096
MDHVLLCVLDFLILSFLCCGNSQDSILTVSPSWLNPGASVTLSCEVKPSSAGWRFYWYKAVPDFSTNYYRYDPLPGSISGTVENSFRIDGQKHTAGFTCRAGKGNPEYLTDYSEPKFVWTSDPHPAASLSVSPDREQHFTSESVTLNCGGNSAEWRVKRFRDGFISFWDEYYEIISGHRLSDCSDSWEMTGSSCTINSNLSFKSVFWCESGSGEFSDAVNISVVVQSSQSVKMKICIKFTPLFYMVLVYRLL